MVMAYLVYRMKRETRLRIEGLAGIILWFSYCNVVLQMYKLVLISFLHKFAATSSLLYFFINRNRFYLAVD